MELLALYYFLIHLLTQCFQYLGSPVGTHKTCNETCCKHSGITTSLARLWGKHIKFYIYDSLIVRLPVFSLECFTDNQGKWSRFCIILLVDCFTGNLWVHSPIFFSSGVSRNDCLEVDCAPSNAARQIDMEIISFHKGIVTLLGCPCSWWEYIFCPVSKQPCHINLNQIAHLYKDVWWVCSIILLVWKLLQLVAI